MENQNPTPPVSATPNATPQPVVPEPQNPQMPTSIGKKRLSLKLIIGIIVFLLLSGGAAGLYIFQQTSKTETKSPNLKKTLDNPNTGDLYQDIKVKLIEKFQ